MKTKSKTKKFVFKDLNNDEKYTLKEEIANSISHGIGTLLSIAGLVLLIVFASFTKRPLVIISVILYGISLFLLYLASTLYHAIQHKRVKQFFEILDHCAIYLLIAGTYSPFCLIVIDKPLGFILFGIVWALAIVGVLTKPFFVKKYRITSTLIYILMGWLVVFFINDVIHNLDFLNFALLLFGGIFYTVGAFFYIYRKIRFGHFIWHIFVLLGSVSHFFAIFLYVL